MTPPREGQMRIVLSDKYGAEFDVDARHDATIVRPVGGDGVIRLPARLTRSEIVVGIYAYIDGWQAGWKQGAKSK